MDEAAELALLDQHLLKTNNLSQRMTTILSQLDTRLSRLDKAIAPLGIQPLSRKAANIDAALGILSPPKPSQPPLPSSSSVRSLPQASSSRSINEQSRASPAVQGYTLDAPSSSRAGPSSIRSPTPTADESAILTRGPDIMSLGEYFSALASVIRDLETIWKQVQEGRGGSREAGIKDLSRLVEVGFQGLVQLFIKQSREGQGRMFEPDSILQNGPPTPPNFFSALSTVLPLSAKMNELVFPSDPTPKTESIIMPLWEEAISGFANLRGDWICRSFGGSLAHVDEIDEGGIWESSRGQEKVKGLVNLWQVLTSVMEAETLLITTLFPRQPPPNLLPLALAHPLNLVNTAMQPTINTIKRSLSTHTFVALDLYQSLLSVREQWDKALRKCLSMTDAAGSSIEEVLDLQNALAGAISNLRSLVSRSFPELLVDMRTNSSGGNTSAISETTYSILSYLEALPTYEKTVEGILSRSQSERSWLMGAKDTPSPARSAAEEGGIVNLYVADVIGTLLINIESRAKVMRKPIGYSFSLNNLSHIRNTTSSFNSDIIGPSAEDMLNKSFRTAKTLYLSEWQNLVALLSSSHTPRFGANPLASSERTHLKEGATAFFDRLAELERSCTENPLNRQDPDMRDRLGKEVEEIVLQGYRPYWTKAQGKGLEKYFKGTPEEIGRRVRQLFR
ncbi:Cullin repeat-like-containing domain protein [Kockovaella imperatae]|uniref:Exocyst complex protein EXO70 n=1 Tax=Kockovaella imperatae TaxID=4999 RepID=A0A1Y1UA81_9TREE|nr:Cullin repeat-like-containing domain protein [Kockovaella imperatae]ORX34454.1 Cullin repeat-like-containing domain protein [Kockovaella imperatae]